MNVLVPIAITEAMLTSSTVAEPASGETAWVSGGTYTKGDRRIRTQTHRVYQALIDHTGRTAAPESDSTYWEDVGPTLRWSMFDGYVSTQSSVVTPLTVVLRPGVFFNAVGLYGLDGAHVSMTVKDAPGGTLVKSYSADLFEPPLDWYDWAFGTFRPLTKLIVSDIIPYPDAELTLTITAAAGITVKAGMLVIGDYRSLLSGAEWGGPEYGAQAIPVDTSYIKTDDFGNLTIKKRRAATDMRISIIVPKEASDYALQTIQDVLAVPCSFVGSDAAGYGGLNVFGLGSGELTYAGPSRDEFSIYVKGIV